MEAPLRVEDTSPILGVYERLRQLHPNWHVELGEQRGAGWLLGTALLRPHEGPFASLLANIGERMQTTNRKIVAASFALRFGWSSGASLAPFLLERCVPDISLENVSLNFTEGALFERIAEHTPRGAMLSGEGPNHPLVERLVHEDGDSEGRWHAGLSARMRSELVAQAEPVVRALYGWSNLPKKTLWGQVLSSWAGQVTSIYAELGRHLEALDAVENLFKSTCPHLVMRPTMYPVSHASVTHVHQRRATCCLYYKLPNTQRCASCPLISQAERETRNRAWMAASVKT